MTNAELIDLLREAQPWIQVHAPIEATDLLMRIDAALAEEAKEQNPCRLIDVGDGGMSRERAEADAFRRGAEAMRDALAQRVDWHGYMADIIRAKPVPEDQ